MAWTDETKAIAIAELQDDPEGRGYAAMSHNQVAVDMALELWVTPTDTNVSADRIMAQVPTLELLAWKSSDHPVADLTYDLVKAFIAGGGTIRGDRVLEIAGSLGPAPGIGIMSADTVAAVGGLLPRKSRCDFLGLPMMTNSRVWYIREQFGWEA